VGDYGYDNGLTIKERVRLKMLNERGQVPPEPNESKYSRGAFLDSQQQSKQGFEMGSKHSYENGSKFGFEMGSKPETDFGVVPFLKFGKADHLFSHINKNVPKANVGELVRDFRIDEEYGMPRDNNLELYEDNKDRLALQDNLV